MRTDCPCVNCLVRSMCGNRITKSGYLIYEELKKCELAKDYMQCPPGFTHDLYSKIYTMCKLFGIKDNNFVWVKSSIYR